MYISNQAVIAIIALYTISYSNVIILIEYFYLLMGKISTLHVSIGTFFAYKI